MFNGLILFSLFLAQLANVLDFLMILPLGPVFLQEFSLTPQQFSLVVSSYSIACAVSGVIAFGFVDRFDRKRLLLFAVGLFTTGNLACALSGSLFSLVVARVVTGIAGGLLEASIFSVVADLFPPERRGRAIGVITSAFAVSSFAGVPLGILIETHYGWRSIFFMICFITVSCFLMCFACIPSLRGHIVNAYDRQHSFGKILSRMSAVMKDPKLRRGLILTAFTMMSVFLAVPFIASALVINGKIAQTDLSIVYMIGGVSALICTPLAGRFTDAIGRWQMFRILTPLGAVAVGGILLLSNVTIFQASIAIVFSMGINSARNVVGNTILADLPDSSNRASYMSLKGAVQNLFAGLASFIGGSVITATADRLEGLPIIVSLSLFLSLLSLPIGRAIAVKRV